MEKHFTATAFVFDRKKVLLVFHKKLNSWLPPGGHVDLNETPPEAACRETREETGLEIAIVPEENHWIESREASSFCRPYLCLLENIPEHKDKPAHQHIDFFYLARLLSKKEGNPELKEIKELRWFSQEEVEGLEEGKEILFSIKRILTDLFRSNKLPL